MSGLYERHGKRLLDLAAIVVAAPVAAPLLAGIAAVVAATDGRPVLFRQARVGRDGREFTILKFRTMRVGTEHHPDDQVARRRRDVGSSAGPLHDP